MWILSKVEIFKMWICQRMRFSRCEFCFFLQFQWNLRGSFAQNYVFLFIPSEIPEVLLLKIQVVQEIQAKITQNLVKINVLVMAILTQGHDKVSQDMQIQCSAMKKPRIGMMGTICVFLTTTWDCKNWVLTWIWAKERQLSNLQALYFTHFHLFLLSKIRHFTAIVIQFSQNETVSRVFIHCGHQIPSIV